MADLSKYGVYGDDAKDVIRNWHNIAKQKKPIIKDWDPRSADYDIDGIDARRKWAASQDLRDNFRKRHPRPRIKILRKESMDMLNSKMLNPLHEGKLGFAMLAPHLTFGASATAIGLYWYRVLGKLKKAVKNAETPMEAARAIDTCLNERLFSTTSHETEKTVRDGKIMKNIFELFNLRRQCAQIIMNAEEDWKDALLREIKWKRFKLGVLIGVAGTATAGIAIGASKIPV